MTSLVYPDHFVVHFLSFLKEPRGLRALDAGCGGGRNSLFLAGAGMQVVGVDQSDGMLARAKTSVAETQCVIDLLQGKLEALPFADGAFDVVICASVLETMTHQATSQAMRELGRVLKPAGYLLVVTAAAEGSEPGYSEEGPEQTPLKARLSTREDLLIRSLNFDVVELLRLELVEPASAPVRAQWALVARKRSAANLPSF